MNSVSFWLDNIPFHKNYLKNNGLIIEIFNYKKKKYITELTIVRSFDLHYIYLKNIYNEPETPVTLTIIFTTYYYNNNIIKSKVDIIGINRDFYKDYENYKDNKYYNILLDKFFSENNI